MIRALACAACICLSASAQADQQESILGRWVIDRNETGKPIDGTIEFSPDGWLHIESAEGNHDHPYRIDGTPSEGRLLPEDKSAPPASYHIYDNGLTLVIVPDEADTRAVVLHRPEWIAMQSPANQRTRTSREAFAQAKLLGYWSIDCTQPMTYNNPYTVYVVPANGGPPQVMTMFGDKRLTFQVDDVQLNGNEVYYRYHGYTDNFDGTVESKVLRSADGLQVVWSHFVGVVLVKVGPYQRGQHIDDETVKDGMLTSLNKSVPVRHFCGSNL